MPKDASGNEFSHLIQVDRIGPEGTLVQLTASAAERESLAKRLQIPAVLGVSAQIRVVPDPALKGQYLLRGSFEAEVEQTCVITLEPVRQRIREDVEQRFAPAELIGEPAQLERDEAEWLDPEAEDPPDPLVNGGIDVSEVVTEALALALDPYPRKPGAELPEQYRSGAESGAAVSPFAALAKLRTIKKD
ncbi:MAG TPA: DUF177 domain-containing protein [Ferrovibrio sp.]|jgi:uncharacterized metal-binding protein YceD (DUF177 family)|uniref:YceD family protein n=1 Tax=Ferrovibrio sp. TaxID=1917215 RepID=UPI002ED35210